MNSAARLRVRPAEARDLDRVCVIVNHFIETTAFNFRIESQQVEEWLHNWERLHRLYPWLVAIEGQRVIGVAYAAPWKARDAYLWTVESTVYVDHECHRRGVGDALYAELLVSDCTSGTVSSR
jgi:phosphinothricin acetyltransferase